MQVGSKAVSNVADKFSKLGQTFNPKILTGKKSARAAATANEKQNANQENANDAVANEGSDAEDATDVVGKVATDANIYNDNSFLQSVGIVMVDAGELGEPPHQAEARKPNKKQMLENVSRMSISSVTDNVNMPLEMLDINSPPQKPEPAPTPEINVQETEDGKTDKITVMKNCHSVADMRSDTSYADEGTRYGHIIILCRILLLS